MKYKYKLCIKIKTMKQILLNSLKKTKQNSKHLNIIVSTLIFSTFILLSLKSNGLFLKEILLCAGILLFLLLNNNKRNLK